MKFIIPGLQFSIVLQSFIYLFFLLPRIKALTLLNKLTLNLIGLLSLHMLSNLGGQLFELSKFPNITFGFGLLYGPSIYLYVKALLYRDFKWNRKLLVHFIPGILLSFSAFFAHVSGTVGAILTFCSMSVYLAISFLEYKRFRNTIKHTESAEDYIANSSTVVALWMNTLVLSINIANFILSMTGSDSQWFEWSEIALFIAVAVSVNIFIITGLTNDEGFKGVTREDVSIEETSRKKLAQLKLDTGLFNRLNESLSNHMESKKPYTQPLFNLQSLARQVGESPKNVSIYINHHLSLSFADFVNRYRIEEVKSKMADEDETRTIIEIAYACGFSTKSNFNRAFKKHEGKTPSEYRKYLRK